MTDSFYARLFFSLFLFLAIMGCGNARADVLQINTGLSTGHFIDGLNATDENPIVFLGADASFDNGAFGGAECYESSSGQGGALPRGCHFYVGYFKPISETQAITFALRHKNYLVTSSTFWRYLEASVDWHVSRNINFSIKATNNWLDQGHSTYGIGGDYTKPLSKTLSAYVSASVMKFEGTSQVNYSEHLELGLKYQKNRWGAKFSFISVDSSLSDFVGFDVAHNQARLTLTYRLY